MTQALIAKVDEPILETGEGFASLAWRFTCDSRNRGLIRQGFDEAALLWKAVKASSGNILEIGRNLAGSTVLLAAAADEVFFQAEDGIRYLTVTGVQTCALPI